MIVDLEREDLGNASPFSHRRETERRFACQLALAGQQDIEPLRTLYRIIVEEGISYPCQRSPEIPPGAIMSGVIPLNGIIGIIARALLRSLSPAAIIYLSEIRSLKPDEPLKAREELCLQAEV